MGKDAQFGKMNGASGCTTVWTYFETANHKLESGKTNKFYAVYILLHTQKGWAAFSGATGQETQFAELRHVSGPMHRSTLVLDKANHGRKAT